MTTIKDVEVNPLEERVTNLENLVNALVKSRTIDKMYTKADINGTRQSVANITPTVITKTAYVGNTKIVFDNIPTGNLTVYFDDSYRIERDNRTNRLTLTFEPLKKATDITISIL